MPDNPKNGAETPEPEATNAPAGTSTPESQAAPEVTPDQLKAIISALQDDLEALKGENLRLVADMQNLRRRTDKEREETAKYAITKFAQDVVGVVDNFERAASAVPAEAAEKDQVLKSFLDGVVLAEREFLSVLERYGVKRIVAQGQPFNPHQHQAVMEREDQSVPPGTILQVFQAGFMIEDRCLRPAMVAVSTGGEKATKPVDAPQPGAEETGAGSGTG